MELEVPRVWLRLRFALSPDGSLRADASDHTGRSVRAPRREAGTPVGWARLVAQVPGRPLPVLFPSDALNWAAEAVGRVPQARTGLHGGPVAVPVFVTPPPDLAYLPWERFVPLLFGPALANRLVAVIDRDSDPAPPFSLPLRVIAVGAGGSDAVQELERRRVWLGVDPEIQPHAAVVEWVEDAANAALLLISGGADVLLLDGWEAADLARRRMRRGLVRLAVVLGVDEPGGLAAAGHGLNAARSVLTIGGPADPGQLQAVQMLFDAMSHDEPLHEAVAHIAHAQPARLVRLEAGPESVHDLRLSDAWGGLVRRAHQLSGVVGVGDLEAAGIQIAGHALRDAVGESHRLTVNFGRETKGLHPLARTRARLSRADDVLRDVTARYRPEDAEPAVPRVVNLGLSRWAGAWEPDASGVYLNRFESLATGAGYDLDVQIGAPWPKTLVVGEQPPIDLMLPDSRDGHLLDVVVLSGDVEVTGPAVRSLRLPPQGGSDLLTFGIRTPERPGPVEVRVSVYHEDHLVQTYRLTALVEETASGNHREDVLYARLEHTATERWDNLDALPPRALSLTLNRAAGGTHRMFLKKGETASVLDLAPQLQDDRTTAVRGVLAQAMTGGLDGESAMWQLARQGAELFRGLFDRLDADGQDALRAIRRGADLPVQVVRADVTYVLPWAFVYDWPLPEVVAGEAQPAACFGDCAHDATSKVLCAKGFWGIRHRVEELLGDPAPQDAAGAVTVRAPTVVLGRGVADAAADTLFDTLGKELGQGAMRVLASADSLLDVLYDAAARPPVVVVIGHHETRVVRGEPEEPRIESGTSERWLMARAVTERTVSDGRWAQPRPVVLLMSCGSAAVRPVDLTSHLSALTGAGAGAVLGTECDVYADLAAHFACEVLGAMAGVGTPAGARLAFGRAVQLARQELVTNGRDIRGFAFSAFGPADLTLA